MRNPKIMHPNKTCGKIRYESKGVAKKQMRLINQRINSKNGGGLNGFYFCVKCGYWHLTSNKTRVK